MITEITCIMDLVQLKLSSDDRLHISNDDRLEISNRDQLEIRAMLVTARME